MDTLDHSPSLSPVRPALLTDVGGAGRRVDAAIGAVPDDAWTQEAVRTDPAWAAIRRATGEALAINQHPDRCRRGRCT